MTSVFLIDTSNNCDIHSYGTELGVNTWLAQGWGRARLPTESIGTFVLTLTNVIVGSTYDVEVLSTGAQITTGTAVASSVILNIPVYSPGDAKNSLRIKLRKASGSPYYQPFETQTTAIKGSSSIFVNQVSDES